MPNDPDLEKVIYETFHAGHRDATVIIFIPEKTRKGEPIDDQDVWADAAHKLFGKLFGGATGFPGLSGSWYDQEYDRVIYESPIMIQTLTKREKVKEENVRKVLDFARRMGKKTEQGCIGVVVSEVFYEISDYD